MTENYEGPVAGPLLAAIETIRPGQWLAIASPRIAEGRAALTAGVGIERLSASLFAAMPISTEARTPLIGWLADASEDESLDAFFTVQGTARDSERRELHMGRLVDVPAETWENVDTVVAVDSAVDFVFFVCVGGDSESVADLFAPSQARAA
ncbi:hypothetical protein [Leifsonia sp. LS-T14]|uniref:hypothetical protein n=1 Tax=unclassified Leifsonia TaxID=2663824 RepID=UPI0035A5AC85